MQFYNRNGILYFKFNYRGYSTGIKIGKIKVRQVPNEEYIDKHYYVTNGTEELCKKVSKIVEGCYNLKDKRSVILFIKMIDSTENTIYFTDYWLEKGNTKNDCNALQLWARVNGERNFDLNSFNDTQNVRAHISAFASLLRLYYKTANDEYKNSTVGVYMAVLKKICKLIEEDYLIRLPLSQLKPPKVRNNVIILDLETLSRIRSGSINDALMCQLCLQIETCSRVESILKIKDYMFVKDEVGYRLDLMSEKDIEIQPRYVREDLWYAAKNYVSSGEWIRGYDVLLNRFREIINPDATVNILKEQNGKYVPVNTHLKDAAGTHTLRKTGINLLRNKGVSDEDIRNNFSYHKSSANYSKYYVKYDKMTKKKYRDIFDY